MQMSFHRWLCIIGFLLLLPACGQDPKSNASCFRCHSMKTLGQRAPTGEIRNLSVSPTDYGYSEHRRLDCVACHNRGYTAFPHKPIPASQPVAAAGVVRELARGSNYREHPELFSCFNCHSEAPAGLRRPSAPPAIPALPRAEYTQIAEEFRRSVHYRKHPDLFSCFSCHDPHSIKRWTAVTRETIAEQNGVCLKCHASQTNYSRIAKRHVPDLKVVHGWLPHQEVHMRQVRCLDCHSSYQPPAKSHAILPKEQAVRDCVKCHSANSVLRLNLYRHQRSQETARLGFTNALIVNNAYVIGATRNRALDTFGALIVGLTVLGVGAHLAARRAARRTSGEPEDE